MQYTMICSNKVAQRVVWRLRRLSEALRDQRRSSYPEYDPHKGTLARYFSLEDMPPLEQDRVQTLALADHFAAHRFDLLGSGWVHVHYGMISRGVGGYRYTMSTKNIHINSAGAWLAGQINPANLSEAQRVWRLIRADNADNLAYVPIDWQLDFKSGWRWSEKTSSSAIRYGNRRGADVKVPWELARMQHLPILAAASALTGESRYADEFRCQVLDFIAANPPRFGVNWVSTMDVAIRVANWLVAYDLFRAHGVTFDAAFEQAFMCSVYAHGLHIRANLDWHEGWRGNSYLADVVGLLFVAAYLPRSPETDAWYTFALEEMLHETALQFNPDGSTREGSTAYHGLSAEMIAYATRLALRRKDAPDDAPSITLSHLARLSHVARFTRHITKLEGHIPQFGDNDSGRFLKLATVYQARTVAEAKARYATLSDYADLPNDAIYWDEDVRDHRPLLALIGSVLKEVRFRAAPRSALTSVGTETDWQDWITRLNAYPQSQRRDRVFEAPGVDLRTELIRAAYPDFGLYIFRAARLYLAIRCGTADLNGSDKHNHADQLSAELSIDGRDVLLDPGTYLYSPLPAMRNRYRSARVHFAPQVAPGDLRLFRLTDTWQTECLYFGEQGFIGRQVRKGQPIYRVVTISAQAVTFADFADQQDVRWLDSETVPFSPGYGVLMNNSIPNNKP